MAPAELGKILNIGRLPAHLRAVEAELERLELPPAMRPALKRSMAGGKRLRPILCLAAAASAGRISQKAISAAAAVELLHLASLVHDDITDKSAERRGQSTIFQHEGLELAILAGDWLLAQSQFLVAALGPQLALILADTFAQMAAGQAAQLSLKPPFNLASRQYITIIRQKTASLMSATCQLGALSAGLDDRLVKALGDYGEYFGVAFQIIDDINDEDIEEANQPAAVQLAKRYSQRAGSALGALPAGPTVDGLAKLSTHYLNWALSR